GRCAPAPPRNRSPRYRGNDCVAGRSAIAESLRSDCVRACPGGRGTDGSSAIVRWSFFVVVSAGGKQVAGGVAPIPWQPSECRPGLAGQQGKSALEAAELFDRRSNAPPVHPLTARDDWPEP